MQVSFEIVVVMGKEKAIDVRPLSMEVVGDADDEIDLDGDQNGQAKAIKPYSGPVFELNDEELSAALNEIKNWKLDAKLDHVERYFFALPQLKQILTGDVGYVIGRKGTGKTAIVEHLSRSVKEESGIYVTKLTFKNFPFNELYSQNNSQYTAPNQYISIWKLIIYAAVCRQIATAPHVDAYVLQQIEKAFPQTPTDTLGAVVGKWIAGDFGISVLGNGFNIGNWLTKKKTFSLQEKIENLEAFINKHCPPGKFFVLFDELDEDYKDIFENFSKSNYLELLTSLFKAVQDVRSSFGRTSAKLYPVIFLRDDIYDLIKDPDRNKWRDLQIDISWGDLELRRLLAHRLSRAINRESYNLDELWYTIVVSGPMRYSGGRKNIRSFDYMKMSTQGRPRDFINYIQECASQALNRSAGSSRPSKITTDMIKDADKAYSNYLRKEMIDEIHGIIPDIDKVLAIFSESRKQILSIEEFRTAYLQRYQNGNLKIGDPDMILRTLFYFSVIGNVVRVGIHVFKHSRPDAVLNFRERIVVHRGLLKSLQII